MNIKKCILISFSFLVGFNTFSQNMPKRNIGICSGVGLVMNKRTEGFGTYHGLSYNQDIWKNRLRFTQQLTYGTYANRFILDATDSYFNSISSKSNLFLNVINWNSNALFLGIGFTANTSKGIVNTTKSNPYFRVWHYGFNGCLLGYRFFNPESRFGFEGRFFQLTVEPSRDEEFVDFQFLECSLLINIH